MNEIKQKATNLEIRLRGLFKRTEEPSQLLTFGGIFTEGNICNDGGFYIAIISVLTQYYNLENSAEIDTFIENIEYTKNLKLEDIENDNIKSIMNDLKNVIGIQRG